jgi:hypothetical protein
MMEDGGGAKFGSKPSLFGGFGIWLLVIALLMSAPMVFINISKASRQRYLVAKEEGRTTSPSTDSLCSARDSALVDKFLLIEANVCQGFPPRNQGAKIENAVENHRWEESDGSLKGVIDVSLRGHIEDTNLVPTINVEIGAHSRDDKLPIVVTDRISGKTMKRGNRGGEWSRTRTELIVSNLNKSVTHVAIHPIAHSKEKDFEVLISYQIRKSKDDKLSAISIDPTDFGEDTLMSVSGTISWPHDIYQQPYYFKWKHEIMKYDHGKKDSILVVPDGLFSRSPMDFKVSKSTRELKYESKKPLASCFAIMYKCQK